MDIRWYIQAWATTGVWYVFGAILEALDYPPVASQSQDIWYR